MGFALIFPMHKLRSSPLSIETMRRNLEATRSSWHNRCVACGRKNGNGLGLQFEVNADGQVQASFACQECFEGFPHALHGGFVAVLLDAAMTNCLFAHGLVGMTGELTVRFRRIVDIGKAARVRAWLECSSHRLHLLRANLEQEGEIRATASGKFLEIPAEERSKNHGGMNG
jgi:acyl-coenzyme A thioesterase PaaI-like protein